MGNVEEMKPVEPMIRGIAHVAIYSNRYEETVSFYKEVFEAKEIGYPHSKRKGCFLSLGKDILEVFESDSLTDGVLKHFAVDCTDANLLYQRALHAGATSYVEPYELTVTQNDENGILKECTVRIAFVRGMAGEQIEFFQRKQ